MSHFAPVHHYAFHVTDEGFDAIFKRVQETGIPWGSDPWSMENRQFNSREGGRSVYFCGPNGHVLELLTRA
jgi:catechol 2,3-dioxygenase-like lactoylglutathione lyase family enzyme